MLQACHTYWYYSEKLIPFGINCADACLTRGTKRKLTQSTLLNFSFSKKVSAEPTSNSLNNEVETGNMTKMDASLSSDQAFFSVDSDIGNSKAGAVKISLPGCLNGLPDISETISAFVPSNNGAVEHCSSIMLPTVATSDSIDACADMYSHTIVAVDTVIVGRRFHDNIELSQDAGITILRDPQNAKDPDAIKVSIFSE